MLQPGMVVASSASTEGTAIISEDHLLASARVRILSRKKYIGIVKFAQPFFDPNQPEYIQMNEVQILQVSDRPPCAVFSKYSGDKLYSSYCLPLRHTSPDPTSNDLPSITLSKEPKPLPQRMLYVYTRCSAKE